MLSSRGRAGIRGPGSSTLSRHYLRPSVYLASNRLRPQPCSPAWCLSSRWPLLSHPRPLQVCAASSYDRLDSSVTALQAPGTANALAYVVGVPPGSTEAVAGQLEQLVRQLEQQQQVLLLLYPAAETETPTTAADSVSDATRQWQQQQKQPAGEDFQEQPAAVLKLCQDLAAAHGLQLQVLEQTQQQPSQALPALAAAADPALQVAADSSSKASLAASSSDIRQPGFRSFMKSGLGLAQRTASAAVAALDAVSSAAAAAIAAERQKGVDTAPDLPDLSLRFRRFQDWKSPEEAALTWQAALMFCAVLQQLEQQGYQVTLTDGNDDDGASRGGVKGFDNPLDMLAALQDEGISINPELTAALEAFMELYALLDEPSDTEVAAWLDLVLEADNPTLVTAELKAALIERQQDILRLRLLKMDWKNVPQPTPAAILQRIQARQSSSSNNKSDVGEDTDSGKQLEKQQQPLGGDGLDAESTEAESPPSEGREEAVDATAAAPDDAKTGTLSSSSAQAEGSRDDSSRNRSSSSSSSSSDSLAASDRKISISSNPRLIDAMMQLERAWKSGNAAGGSAASSTSAGRGQAGGSAAAARKPSSSSSNKPADDRPVPELLPRPIRPPQPNDSSSSSSSSSSSAGDGDGNSSSVSASGSTSPSQQQPATAAAAEEEEGEPTTAAAADAAPDVGKDASGHSGQPSAAAAAAAAKRRIRRIRSGDIQAGRGAAGAAAADVDAACAAASSKHMSDAEDAQQKQQPSRQQQQLADGEEQQQGQVAPAAAADVAEQQQHTPQQVQSSSSTNEHSNSSEAGSLCLPAQQQQQGPHQHDAAAAGAGAETASAGRASAAAAAAAAGAETASAGRALKTPEDEAEAAASAQAAPSSASQSGAEAGPDTSGSSTGAPAKGAGIGQAATPEADAAADAEATSKPEEEADAEDVAEDVAAIKHAFALFEEQLEAVGMKLSREERLELFSQLYAEADDSSDDSSDEDDSPTDESEEGNEPSVADKFRFMLAKQNQPQPSSSRSSGSNSNSSSGGGSGWEQLRRLVGSTGMERLADLLKADGIRMRELEQAEVHLLLSALNRLQQGDSLSTMELQVLLRMLNEAEISEGQDSDINEHLKRRAKALKRQRAGSRVTGFNRSGASARVPGFNVSAKDRAYLQDTRSVRLPKPFGRRRGERVQQLLRQQRQQVQQQRLARQQRAAQLQLWQQQREKELKRLTSSEKLEQGDDSAASTEQVGSAGSSGDGGRFEPNSSPAAAASAASQLGISWAKAVSKVKAVLQWPSSSTQQPPQQPKQFMAGLPGSAAGVTAAEQEATAFVHQLQIVLQQHRAMTAAPRAVVVAVVPLEQLRCIEQAWEEASTDHTDV